MGILRVFKNIIKFELKFYENLDKRKLFIFEFFLESILESLKKDIDGFL